MMPGNTRDILFGSSTLRLNWTFEEHDVGRASRDDIHGLTILFPALDLATGKFASESIGLHNEAAAVLLGHCGKPNLVCSAFPGEDLAALIRIRRPCSGEVHGMRLFNNHQARQCRGSDGELE